MHIRKKNECNTISSNTYEVGKKTKNKKKYLQQPVMKNGWENAQETREGKEKIYNKISMYDDG